MQIRYAQKPVPHQFSAVRALEAILAAGKAGKQPVRVYPFYPCQDCHRWHLTSKKLTGKLPTWERRHLRLGLAVSSRQSRQ